MRREWREERREKAEAQEAEAGREGQCGPRDSITSPQKTRKQRSRAEVAVVAEPLNGRAEEEGRGLEQGGEEPREAARERGGRPYESAEGPRCPRGLLLARTAQSTESGGGTKGKWAPAPAKPPGRGNPACAVEPLASQWPGRQTVRTARTGDFWSTDRDFRG